jgi:manganese transport protein
VSRLLGPLLGVVSAIGGFVDTGELVIAGQVGARYGLGLTWALLLGLIGICVFSEMAGRVVAASGRPVFDLARERLGPNVALVNLVATFLVTLLTLAAQIGGIALTIELASGIPHVAWLVPAGLAVWLVIWRVRFQAIEAVIGVAGLAVAVFAVAVFVLDPDWGALAAQAARPAPPSGEPVPTYLYYGVILFAASMTPYAVIFFSSAGVEERWRRSDIPLQRASVLLGFPIGALLTLGVSAAAAVVLAPRAAPADTFAHVLLPVVLALGAAGAVVALIGFLAVTTGAAIECALSVGYALGQYGGWEWGKLVPPARAARFHLSIALTLLAAVLVVQTGVDPITIVQYALVFSAVALPLTYLPVLVVANDEEYMGDAVNGRLSNGLGLLVLAVVLVAAAAAIPLMVMTGAGE